MRALLGNRIGVSHGEWAARFFWAALWMTLLAFLAPRFVVGDDVTPVWRKDFETALQEAEERKLPLLLHFYADWCMPCKRMDQTVFASAQVKDHLSKRFVAAKLNSEKNQRLVQRYGVEILPADLILDPVSGRVLNLHTGLMEQAEYMAMIQQSEASFHKLHPAQPAITTTVAVPDAKVAAPHLGDPQHVVGLDGFSPVELHKSRKWTRGSPQFAWDYKGVAYFMATREEFLEFRKNPEIFAPKMLGCDPVILWQTDRAVAGNVEFGAYFNDELYLFKSDERRKQFKANPEKFTRLQHALKATQIERTVMR
jgi:YHS domain-containing protein/thiol-disulfide isomerase/thioredoxin